MALNFNRGSNNQISIADDGRTFRYKLDEITWRAVKENSPPSLDKKHSGSISTIAQQLPEVQELNASGEINIYVDPNIGFVSPVNPIRGDRFRGLREALVWISQNARLSNLDVVVKLSAGDHLLTSNLGANDIHAGHLRSLTITSEQALADFSYASLRGSILGSTASLDKTVVSNAVKAIATTLTTNTLGPYYKSNILAQDDARLVISGCRKVLIRSLKLSLATPTVGASTAGFSSVFVVKDCQRCSVENVFGNYLLHKDPISFINVSKVSVKSCWLFQCSSVTLDSKLAEIDSSIIIAGGKTTDDYALGFINCKSCSLSNSYVSASAASSGIVLSTTTAYVESLDVTGNTSGITSRGSSLFINSSRINSSNFGINLLDSSGLLQSCVTRGCGLGLISRSSYITYRNGEISNCGPYSGAGTGLYLQGGIAIVGNNGLSGNNAGACELRGGGSIAVYSNTASQGANPVRGFTTPTFSPGQGIYTTAI